MLASLLFHNQECHSPKRKPCRISTLTRWSVMLCELRCDASQVVPLLLSSSPPLIISSSVPLLYGVVWCAVWCGVWCAVRVCCRPSLTSRRATRSPVAMRLLKVQRPFATRHVQARGIFLLFSSSSYSFFLCFVSFRFLVVFLCCAEIDAHVVTGVLTCCPVGVSRAVNNGCTRVHVLVCHVT